MKVLPSTSVSSAPAVCATATGVTCATARGVCSSASRMRSRLLGPGTSVTSFTDEMEASLRLLDDLGHDVLDSSVVFQCVDRHVLAVAGLLEAAVRHLAHHGQVVVDPDRAEAQPARRVQRPVHVPTPDRGGQAVVYVVGPADRLVVVLERRDCYHRAEHLALDYLVLLLGVGDDRVLEEEAWPLPVPSARQDLHVSRGLRPLHEAAHAVELLCGHQRPHLRLLGV